MDVKYLAALGRYVPELVACLTMVSLILLESCYSRKEKGRSIFNFCAYLGLGVTLITLGENFSRQGESIFTGTVAIDSFSTMIKIIMVLATISVIYLGHRLRDIGQNVKGEFVIIAVGVLIGGMLLASASNMLILYIGVETLSILSYVLSALKKDEYKSSEAGLKYALFGGVSAAIMLFGMSHIYGVTGTLHFAQLATALKGLEGVQLAIILPSFLLFFVGLGHKIACVPFHMWSPDVYEGSPLPVTAFFSIVPKMAALAAIIRISLSFFGEEGLLQNFWIGLLVVTAAVTMTVGTVSAIGQRSIKRMLAYSSIGHVGMMLMGVIIPSQEITGPILFYATSYLFMTLGAFYIVGMVCDEDGNEDFERLNGLFFRHPLMAIILSAIMLSLAGVPPLSGFFAKFNILAIIIQKGHYTLAVIAVINSAISLYYYLRPVVLMSLRPADEEKAVINFKGLLGLGHQSIIFIIAVPTVFMGLFFTEIMSVMKSSNILLP